MDFLENFNYGSYSKDFCLWKRNRRWVVSWSLSYFWITWFSILVKHFYLLGRVLLPPMVLLVKSCYTYKGVTWRILWPLIIWRHIYFPWVLELNFFFFRYKNWCIFLCVLSDLPVWFGLILSAINPLLFLP